MYTLVSDSVPTPRIAPAPETPTVVPEVELRNKSVRPGVAEVLQGFAPVSRGFGEVFDLSSHAAVIKMMMLRFGRSPSDMFETVEATKTGYSITMKDGFEVTLSAQELQRTCEASRLTGPDAPMGADANFMLAAFAKRKQVEGNVEFDAALSSTLRGEHTYRVLKGMGLIGFIRVVPPINCVSQAASALSAPLTIRVHWSRMASSMITVGKRLSARIMATSLPQTYRSNPTVSLRSSRRCPSAQSLSISGTVSIKASRVTVSRCRQSRLR